MSFTPAKTGQVVVPVNARAFEGLTAQEIADRVAPTIIAVARAQGGHPIGSPELLTSDELRSRTDDPTLLRMADSTATDLYIVCEMIPADQAADVARARGAKPPSPLEVVSRPVIPGRHRPRR